MLPIYSMEYITNITQTTLHTSYTHLLFSYFSKDVAEYGYSWINVFNIIYELAYVYQYKYYVTSEYNLRICSWLLLYDYWNECARHTITCNYWISQGLRHLICRVVQQQKNLFVVSSWHFMECAVLILDLPHLLIDGYLVWKQ